MNSPFCLFPIDIIRVTEEIEELIKMKDKKYENWPANKSSENRDLYQSTNKELG